jgi:cytosine/adenosine deaminase-related metal-dependent hydrolase
LTPTALLTNVRPWGGPPRDLLLGETAILAAVNPGATDPAPDADSVGLVIDGGGRIALPAFSDVHVHLDSNRLGLPFRPHTGTPGRWGSILDDRAHWRGAEWPVADRASHALRRMIELGTTRVRSHASVDADSRLEKLEGVLSARETHRARADVEVVAFPQVGIHLEGGVVALLEEALRMGADLVGGIDPCEIDRDPVRHLDTVFDLAHRCGVGIDIHVHEPGPLGRFSLDLIVERTRALSMHGQVTVSHAFCLTDGSAAAEAAIDTLAELDIAVTTVAPQGMRSHLPLRRLVQAGVRVGLGMDGQRDYWSPYGNADMLDRAWQLAFTQGYVTADDLELALAVATWGGVGVLDADAPRLGHGPRAGLDVGDPSELVVLAAESAASSVMDRPTDRVVIHRGRPIARNGALL